ncbi:hybrid sensor histidine kinase/response regulator [Noviherbaspirillum galbum]|uniref:histidine kinase n=1 Tax=Noviherbaspirillum galbum TaxID=2709383 RepID=A0A6B3SMG7_9BURK|nr:ATP-binding protein [Noviherbaspirillum galbum]NEX61923.1 response regulator [Noviherbaspirillum galbum]
MRIRTRLLVLVLSVLVPAFIAAMFAVWFVYTEQQDAQRKSVAETSRAMALLIDKQMQTTEGTLRALATSPSLATGDLAAFHAQARKLVPTDTSVVVLNDLGGKQLLNTRLPFGTVPAKGGSNLAELRRQAGPERTIISDLFFAPAGKHYDYAVQVPVEIDGQVRYYLSMGIMVSELRALLNQQKVPTGWIVSLSDRKGVVATRSDEPDKYVGTFVREALRQKILAGMRSGLHYGVTLSGTPTAAFFTRAPLSEWTIVVNVPLAEMRRPAMYAAALLSGIMLFLFGAAIFAARWYARNTAEPIEELRLAAEKLGRGEQLVPTPSGLVETDAVGFAMVNSSNQIIQSRVELELRVAEAVASAERAQRALLQAQKLEALGRLTGGIAHDFNNILQTLSTSLQLIQFTDDRERIEALLETCDKAIDRATVLTGQMRSFGRIQDARLQTVRLDETISAAMPLFASALPSNIELIVQADDAPWPVTIDPLQLELALLNIVINARDAMANDGWVKIAVSNQVIARQSGNLAPGEYVCIAVTDNGHGMSAEVLSKALDPFFTTKGVDKGSGLGLPQAYGFATQARGTLVVDSAEGKGTTVTIFLPRAADHAPPALARERARQPSSAAGTLLFVEDDALVRESVEPALKAAGFQVIVAGNGEEAVSCLESDPSIDMVFSDIIMPGNVSGIDLAKMIKIRYPHIHIVLATGYSDRRVDIPGVQLLAKPYKITDAIQLLTVDA